MVPVFVRQVEFIFLDMFQTFTVNLFDCMFFHLDVAVNIWFIMDCQDDILFFIQAFPQQVATAVFLTVNNTYISSGNGIRFVRRPSNYHMFWKESLFLWQIISSTQKSRPRVTSATLRVTVSFARVRRSCIGFSMVTPERWLCTITGECVLGRTAICFAALIRLGSSLSVVDMSASSLTAVPFCRHFSGERDAATGCDCYGTSLCSAGKICVTHRSINNVVNRTSTARLLTTTNHIRIQMSPNLSGSRTTSSNVIGSWLALLSLKYQCRLIWLTHERDRKDLLSKFGPGLGQIRHFTSIVDGMVAPMVAKTF